MNRFPRWVLALLALIVLAIPAFGVTYAVYYDCTADRQTAVVVSDVGGLEANESLVVTVYDRDGGSIVERTIELTNYGSEVVFLSELVAAAGNSAWGLVTVEGDVFLQVATWIGDSNGWIAANHVTRPFLDPEDLGYTYYWHSIGYANTESRKTGLVLANANAVDASGDIRFFDASGSLLDVLEFELPAHAATYQPTELRLEESDDAWGLIDVRATAPLILVAEFFDAAGGIIDVDQETAYYYAR